MTRALAIAVCALVAFAVLLLAAILSERVEPGPRAIASTSERTETTTWSNGPSITLPSGFDPRRVEEWTHPKPATKQKRVMGELSWHGHACSGDLPPCWVMRRESGGDVNAYNPRGCGGRGCYGKWQFSGEWACHFGLSCDIAGWTEAEQDAAARALFDHGRGCSHWGACV